jgi:hypothetical protein
VNLTKLRDWRRMKGPKKLRPCTVAPILLLLIHGPDAVPAEACSEDEENNEVYKACTLSP